MTPPLCVIQARYGSTRLPGKLLLTLRGETLIARAWRVACEAFGAENCVVAIPAADATGPLGDELARLECEVFTWHDDPADVLGRVYTCAAMLREHPRDVIVRYTPDDWNKQPDALRRVAAGEVLPVEVGGEACTLAELYWWHMGAKDPALREHFGRLLTPNPAAPPVIPWSIDEQWQYDAAVAAVGK